MDLAPSAHETIVNALPTTQSKHGRHMSEADKLAQLPAPSSVKSAWQRSRASNTPLSPRAQGKQPQTPLPTDSFVFLQDSMIQSIPSPSAKSKGGALRSPQRSEPPPTEQTSNPSSRTHHLQSTVRLFNLLSTRTDIDHPLCAECTQILLTSLQRQLEETRKERDGYLAFEREVKKEREREPHGMSQQEAEQKISTLRAEQEYAMDDLKKAERERHVLQEEMQALELEEAVLATEEAAYVLTLLQSARLNGILVFGGLITIIC